MENKLFHCPVCGNDVEFNEYSFIWNMCLDCLGDSESSASVPNDEEVIEVDSTIKFVKKGDV